MAKKKRSIFRELMEGIKAMKEQRESKLTGGPHKPSFGLCGVVRPENSSCASSVQKSRSTAPR